MSENEVNLLATTDAKVWAEEWYRIFQKPDLLPDGDYVEWMIGWFASAFTAQEFADAKRIAELEADVESWKILANSSRVRAEAAEADVARLRTCKTCGQDKIIAEIGAQFGYRADIMGLEVKNLLAKLRAVGELRRFNVNIPDGPTGGKIISVVSAGELKALLK